MRTNQQLADDLYSIAERLEGEGENPYRIRAYRRAARVIKHHPENIEKLLQQEFDLTSLHWIGPHIADLIKKIIQTGTLPTFKSLTLEDKFRLGKKRTQKYERRGKIYYAISVLEALRKEISSMPGVEKIEIGRSYRRRKEVVGNAEIFVLAKKPKSLINAFINLPVMREILLVETRKAIVILRSGMQVTLYVVAKNNFATAVLFSTGNKDHLERLKKIARQKNFVLNEKGIFKQEKPISITSEEKVYTYLGLSYIPPELRENRGEIEAAKKHQLPELIELKDIKGDLHSHTNETDGVDTLEVMVNAVREMGYQYLAITDHTKRLKITNGLDEKRLAAQIKLIDKMNTKYSDFVILKSSEVDILEDGTLDLPDWILKELDIRVCSIHSRFRISKEKQTQRLLRAMDNPYFNILGHMTGRLINSRTPYELDIEKIFQAAKDRNCFIELNAQPARLDIHDEYCMLAKSMGLKVAISSDAHSTRELHFMPLGINQARRGWLSADDVINTRRWQELKRLIKR